MAISETIHTPNIAERVRLFTKPKPENNSSSFPKDTKEIDDQIEKNRKKKAEPIEKMNLAKIKAMVKIAHINMKRELRDEQGIDITIPSKVLNIIANNLYSQSNSMSAASMKLRSGTPTDLKNKYNSVIRSACKEQMTSYVKERLKKKNGSDFKDIPSKPKKRMGIAA